MKARRFNTLLLVEALILNLLARSKRNKKEKNKKKHVLVAKNYRDINFDLLQTQKFL
jgi:hypothetical protein